MAMAMGAEPETHRVTITVVDHDKEPVVGASLTFEVENTLYGQATIGSRPVTIELSDDEVRLTVKAKYSGQKQEVSLSPDQRSYTFYFTRTVTPQTFGPPVATCPDGTSGQPCVDCVIGGNKIRICV
jgi:hypothetical protein